MPEGLLLLLLCQGLLRFIFGSFWEHRWSPQTLKNDNNVCLGSEINDCASVQAIHCNSSHNQILSSFLLCVVISELHLAGIASSHAADGVGRADLCPVGPEAVSAHTKEPEKKKVFFIFPFPLVCGFRSTRQTERQKSRLGAVWSSSRDSVINRRLLATTFLRPPQLLARPLTPAAVTCANLRAP